MERVLLVEPEYDNKYPPIGLMKIATYHKEKGDYVEFYKGKAPYNIIAKADRVYITTIFTFYYEIIVDTIQHYLKFTDEKRIYVGGIAATLLFDRFTTIISEEQLLKGQLYSSSLIGYDDDVNIDTLPLDYDILDDIEYNYGNDSCFFAYATRGCPRKCAFCAVKTLEPNFCETYESVRLQIENTRNRFGDMRHIMMMDNNILFSKNLKDICEMLNSLGFTKNTKTFIPNNPAAVFFGKFERRISNDQPIDKIADDFIEYLKKFSNRLKKEDVKNEFIQIIADVSEDINRCLSLLVNRTRIIQIVEKYYTKNVLPRYVDFNQGMDARFLTEEKMKILSTLPIRPFRLAFDDIDCVEEYSAAFELAYKYGVRHFSNYMLYNYEDSTEDFWLRIKTNIDLYNKYPDVSAFSFPMKYAPVDEIGRSYVGKNWNKKYLSAMNVILNVTKGVIAKERDFFEHAYGKTVQEFHEILSMPNEFIKYREYFDENGLSEAWRARYRILSRDQKDKLFAVLSGEENTLPELCELLTYYKITKNQVVNKRIDINNYI